MASTKHSGSVTPAASLPLVPQAGENQTLLPFVSGKDQAQMLVSEYATPALLINPAASATILVSAAMARVDMLKSLLLQSALVVDDGGNEESAQQLSEALLPLAEQAFALLERVSDLKPGREGASS